MLQKVSVKYIFIMVKVLDKYTFCMVKVQMTAFWRKPSSSQNFLSYSIPISDAYGIPFIWQYRPTG